MNRPGVRGRLFALLSPQRQLLGVGLASAMIGSVLDGTTAVLLIPILKLQFNGSFSLGGGSSLLERFLGVVLAPIIADVPREVATLRLVLLFLTALALKILASYTAAYLSVLVQEGVVKALRLRLWQHLLRLDLSVFQRTRGGSVAIWVPRGASGSSFMPEARIAGSRATYIQIHITSDHATSAITGPSICTATSMGSPRS